jgi:hypothetical protein
MAFTGIAHQSSTPALCFSQADGASSSGWANQATSPKVDPFEIATDLLKEDFKDQNLTRKLVESVWRSYFPSSEEKGNKIKELIAALISTLCLNVRKFEHNNITPSDLLTACCDPKLVNIWSERTKKKGEGADLYSSLAYEVPNALNSFYAKANKLNLIALTFPEPDLRIVSSLVDEMLSFNHAKGDAFIWGRTSPALLASVDNLMTAIANRRLALRLIKPLDEKLDIFGIRPGDIRQPVWEKYGSKYYSYGFGKLALNARNEELLKFILERHPVEALSFGGNAGLTEDQISLAKQCIDINSMRDFLDEMSNILLNSSEIKWVKDPRQAVISTADFFELADVTNSGLTRLRERLKEEGNTVPTPSKRRAKPIRAKSDLNRVAEKIDPELFKPERFEELISLLLNNKNLMPTDKVTKALTPQNIRKFLIAAVSKITTDDYRKEGAQVTSRIKKILDFLTTNKKFRINDRFDGNKTLLMVAAEKGNEYFIEVLREFNANPKLKDRCNKRAEDHARENGHIILAGYLKEDAKNFQSTRD